MFGKKKQSTSPWLSGKEKFATIIGPQTTMQGDMRLHESLRIDGKVVGDIQSDTDQAITVVVGVNGQVHGGIKAHCVVVAGQVVGNIFARERVELYNKCRVEGDIRYASMAIEHGATVMGRMLQTDEKHSDTVVEITPLPQGKPHDKTKVPENLAEPENLQRKVVK